MNKKWKLPELPGIAYGTLLAFVIFSIISPRKFLTVANLLLILRHSCILAMASAGMTLVALVSQVDLSIGSVMSLSGVVIGLMLRTGINLTVSLITGLSIGGIFGLVNGIMVAKLKLDYWISTFATMSIGAGLALVLSNASTIAISSSFLNWFGNGKIGSVDIVIIFTTIILALISFALKKSKLGYNLYSIGGSEIVAKVSGINVVKFRIIPYVFSGVFAAVAGILVMSMNGTASPIIGTDYSFNALAAVIIGGTALEGGKGSIGGTILGTLLLRTLTSGLNVMGVASTWQKTIIGIVIVGIICLDVLTSKRKKVKGSMRIYAD